MNYKLTREELPEVMTVKDVREFLGIGRRQSYELMEHPPFHVARVGKLYKISKKSFIEWFDGDCNE
jgi:Helix-turn-helix domain